MSGLGRLPKGDPVKYKVSYLNQGRDGWLASIYVLPGCHVEGQTREEAKERLKDALHYYFDDTSNAELVDETEWED